MVCVQRRREGITGQGMLGGSSVWKGDDARKRQAGRMVSYRPEDVEGRGLVRGS
jgi:hypothetical protein